MKKINLIILSFFFLTISFSQVNSEDKFNNWLTEFKSRAINEGILRSKYRKRITRK